LKIIPIIFGNGIIIPIFASGFCNATPIQKYKNMLKQRIFDINKVFTDMKKRQKELLKNILEGLEIAGYIIVGTVLMWIAFFLICITGDL
jgi:hypothetical protein